jgi:hypothetical protein
LEDERANAESRSVFRGLLILMVVAGLVLVVVAVIGHGVAGD